MPQEKMSKLDKTHQSRPNLRQVPQTFETESHKHDKPETKFGNLTKIVQSYSKLRLNLRKMHAKDAKVA